MKNMLKILLASASIVAINANVPFNLPNQREARSNYWLTLGNMILDVKCQDTDRNTVCAPGGHEDCPKNYDAIPNIGACGFATLSHFINSGNIAGTCCVQRPPAPDPGPAPAPAPGAPAPAGGDDNDSDLPEILMYGVPVYTGYIQPPQYGMQDPDKTPLYVIETRGGQSPARRIDGKASEAIAHGNIPEFKITEVYENDEVRS